MTNLLKVDVPFKPPLHSSFIPAVLWIRTYQEEARRSGYPVEPFHFALVHPHSVNIVRYSIDLVPPLEDHWRLWSLTYVERICKTLLWIYGAKEILVAGNRFYVETLQTIYRRGGLRDFDVHLIGYQVYGEEHFQIRGVELDQLPLPKQTSFNYGGHREGFRIGFDLGGTSCKAVALQDGNILAKIEKPWDPYFQTDPCWHRRHIEDLLQTIAQSLPIVQAIGGSSAGVFLNNEVKVSSLFRGVLPRDFNSSIRFFFRELEEKWKIPLVICNDGEVSAVAGSLLTEQRPLLGLSLGTSLGAGYVDQNGFLTNYLNELAFVPIDFHPQAPVDEWSLDRGCAVQYLSIQALQRLFQESGWNEYLPQKRDQTFTLLEEALCQGNSLAQAIVQTMGYYLGYAIAYFSLFYDIRCIVLLGGVMKGKIGDKICVFAQELLEKVFPELAKKITLFIPSVLDPRYMQAFAAATLPNLK